MVPGCLPLLLLAGATWTVDDDGPADFPSPSAAIASPAVSDGDTLLVAEGVYPSFTLDKALRVVAEADGWFRAPEVDVAGVPSFTLVGLVVRELRVSDVPGRGVLDRVSVGFVNLEVPSFPVYEGGARVSGCDELVVSRSRFDGGDGCYPDLFSTEPGLVVEASRVALVDCTLSGGEEDACGTAHPVFDGAEPALVAVDSEVWVAGCDLRGADGMPGLVDAAPAILLENASVKVRGSSSHLLRGGRWGFAREADAIAGSGRATVSGVNFDPSRVPAWVALPAVPEPWLRVIGSDVPGTTKTIEVYGPAGAPARVLVGRQPQDPVPPRPGLDPLWFARTSLRRLDGGLLLGPNTPATFPLPLPASTAGAGEAVWLQAYLLPHPGTPGFLSSPAQVVLGW